MPQIPLSIPKVSHEIFPYTYYPGMPHATRGEWRSWATRFREECRRRELSLGQVAERLDVAESTVRSWTNGNREINLGDFFRLCAAAEIDPQRLLFTEQNGQKVNPPNEKLDILARAWQEATPVWREQLLGTAEAILKDREISQVRRARSPSSQRR